MNTTTSKPDLLWNDRWQIGCTRLGHAPKRGSETWRSERWREINPREREAWERHLGSPLACDICAAEGRRKDEAHDRP